MAVDIGSAVGHIDLDISNFLSGLQKAQAEASAKMKSIFDTVNKNLPQFENKLASAGSKFSAVGTKMQSVGKGLTASVTTPIVGVGTVAVKTAAEFESAMSKVGAISGAQGDELVKLSDKAKEMGAKTKFSATESAEAFQYMAMAGWKTEDMLDGISGIMSLAAADGLDLATTSDIVTDALTAFGLKASDSGHFADVLAAASSNANTNVSMLGESFKYVAPVAGAMGYSAEDTAVALGLMANAGIKASQGGTSLRTMLTNLAKPTDTIKWYMEQLGITLDDGNGNMKNLDELMGDLRNSFSDMKMPVADYTESYNRLTEAHEQGLLTDKQYEKNLENLNKSAFGAEGALKAEAAAALAGKTGMAGLLAIVNTSEKDYNKLKTAIYESSDAYGGQGKAAEMADKMLDNLNGQVTLLKSALEGVAIEIGNILLPHLKNFVSFVQNLTDKFASLSTAQKEQVVKIAAIVAAIGPLLLVGGKITSGIGTLLTALSKTSTVLNTVKTGFTVLKTAIAGVSTPVLAIVAVIGVLAAAFTSLMKNNEQFRNKIIGIFNEIKGTITYFVSEVKSRFSGLNVSFENITKALSNAWNRFCNLLAPVFELVFKQISNILKTVTKVILGILDVFIGVFTGDWKKAFEGLKTIVTSIFNGVKSIIKTALDFVKNIIKSQVDNIKSFWGGAWNAVKKVFTDVWNAIKSFFSSIGNTILNAFKTFINNIIKFFSNLPYNIGLVIGKIIGAVASFATNFAKKATDAGKNFLNNLINNIKNLPNKIQNNFTNVANKATSFASNFKAKATKAGTDFINGVVNAIKNLPNKIQSAFTSAINKAQAFANNLKTKGASAASNFLSAVVNGLKNIPSAVSSVGKNIVDGIWSGIQSAKDALMDKVKSFANGIVDGIKSTLQIHSPSKKFKNDVGKHIPSGIAEGVKANEKTAVDSVKNVGNKVLGVIKTTEIGKEFANKMTTGIKQNTAKAGKAAQNMGEKVLEAAETTLNNYKVYHNLSAQAEAEYWDKIRKQVKSGTQARIDADAKYFEAKKQADSELLTQHEDYINKQKEKNKISLDDELIYWTKIRSEFKKGSDAYKEASVKITEAKKAEKEALASYRTEILTAEKDYNTKIKDLQKTTNEQIKSLWEEYNKTVSDKANSLRSALGGLFDSFKPETENTTSTLLSNLKSQVTGFKDWENNIGILEKKGLTKGLLKEIKAMGPSASADIELLTQMSDKQLAKYQKLWQQKMNLTGKYAIKENEDLKTSIVNQQTKIVNETEKQLTKLQASYQNKIDSLTKTAKNKIGALPNEFKNIGINSVDGMINGVKSKENALESSMVSMAKKAVKAAKKELGIHSPSRVFRDEIGKMLPPGISEGFEKAMPKTTEAIRNTFNDSMDKLKNKLDVLQVESKIIGPDTSDISSSFEMQNGIINYDLLAQKITDVLRLNPIQNNVNVEMLDGDVIMDGERVGRKVAPVVSRVVAIGQA